MKPGMLDPERDLKGATPETLARFLDRSLERLRSPRHDLSIRHLPANTLFREKIVQSLLKLGGKATL